MGEVIEISNEALLELLTLTSITDEWGTVRYFNSDGLLHRIHGPACIFKGGFADWFVDGKHMGTKYYTNTLTSPVNMSMITQNDYFN